jgi:hypothetical protein
MHTAPTTLTRAVTAARHFALVALLVALGGGCHGPGQIEFSAGQCMIDGRPATLGEVETRQARLSERIVARQPLAVAVTVLVVLLAGASHIEKLFLLFNARKSQGAGLGERIRQALDRYRAHPLRYFAIVFATLMLLGVAGGFYVYLDADKRASERALGLLQFCHLALRNDEAQGILAEQRRNLASIESTAGNIRSLVDKLPPEEQKKARQIVEQINVALDHQGKLVNDYMSRSDESAKEAEKHAQLLERGLSSLEAELIALKAMPASVQKLAESVQQADARTQGALGAEQAKLTALEARLEALAARPACPACVCDRPPQAPATGEKLAAATPAASAPAASPATAAQAATAPSTHTAPAPPAK